MKTIRDLLNDGTVSEYDISQTMHWMVENRDLYVPYNNELGCCRHANFSIDFGKLTGVQIAVLREIILNAKIKS